MARSCRSAGTFAATGRSSECGTHSGCGRTYGEHRIGHWKAESFTFEAVKCVLVKALDLELRRSSPAAADSPATWLARLLMSPAERVTAAAGAQGGMAAHKIPISTACHPDITSERHLHYLRANHPHPSPCDTPTQPNSSGEPFLDPPLIRGQSPLCSRHCGSATRPPRSSPPALGAPPGFLGARPPLPAPAPLQSRTLLGLWGRLAHGRRAGSTWVGVCQGGLVLRAIGHGNMEAWLPGLSGTTPEFPVGSG